MNLAMAIRLAAQVHCEQSYGNGPYVLHPIRVMQVVRARGYVEAYQVVAVLHDVLEDTNLMAGDLLYLGMGEETLGALKAVTRRAGESYFEFIHRAAQHPIGRVVKYHDVRDNLAQGPPASLRVRYEQALRVLAEAINAK